MPKMPAPLEVITGQRRRRRWTDEEKAGSWRRALRRGEHLRGSAAQWRCPRAARPQSGAGGTAGRLSQVGAHAVSAGERSVASEPILRRRLRVPQQAHGQSEASGVGRQRHGASDEVAAPGTLHLAAPAASFNPPNHICKETADQKPKSGKLEYCQKPNQRCSSGRSLFFTDD